MTSASPEVKNNLHFIPQAWLKQWLSNPAANRRLRKKMQVQEYRLFPESGVYTSRPTEIKVACSLRNPWTLPIDGLENEIEDRLMGHIDSHTLEEARNNLLGGANIGDLPIKQQNAILTFFGQGGYRTPGNVVSCLSDEIQRYLSENTSDKEEAYALDVFDLFKSGCITNALVDRFAAQFPEEIRKNGGIYESLKWSVERDPSEGLIISDKLVINFEGPVFFAVPLSPTAVMLLASPESREKISELGGANYVFCTINSATIQQADHFIIGKKVTLLNEDTVGKAIECLRGLRPCRPGEAKKFESRTLMRF